jgi:Domain of unknown function (DUF4365)
MPKRCTKQSEAGEAGMALIGQLVTAMGYIWHPRRTDHGIDGEIELVERGPRRPINRIISVQSKARQRFPGEDAEGFHYICNVDDANYWSEANVPVILVCSHPSTGEAWWAPVGHLLKDPARRRTRRIDFDKQRDRFDDSAASALLDLGVPPSGGLYVPTTMRRPERLTSNLLSVERIPPTIWAAPSTVPGNREAREVLRRHRVFATDWMVHDGTVFSFRRPDEEPLSLIVDGRAEAIDSAEWAEAKSADTSRDFVRLLNWTLAELHHRELRRHPRRHYFYFRPTSDLVARKVSTGKSRSGRVVFRAYPDAHRPDNAHHFRHHAVDHQFVRLDGRWLLELNPTYHFTSDGYRDLPWGAELVKGMKRREKNNAVRALVEMWAGYLTRRDDLFVSREDEPIQFGDLQTFDVDRGVDDRAWKQPLAAPSVPEGVATLFEAS